MDNFIIKIDHQINEKNNLTGRYFFGDSLQTEQDITVLRPEWRSTSDLNAQVLGVNWIWAPNVRWVNEAKFGYNRFWQKIQTADADKDPVATYGINAGAKDPANFGMPTVVISGFNQLGGNSGWPLFTIPNKTFQFADNISDKTFGITARPTTFGIAAARGASGSRATGLSTEALRLKTSSADSHLAATFSSEVPSATSL